MSLAKVFREHPERRYIMFGGKGGLGKTTFSAATAYWLAEQGKRVLVFSVDPQASLSDIFQQDIFGKGAVEIIPNLFAQEIDAAVGGLAKAGITCIRAETWPFEQLGWEAQEYWIKAHYDLGRLFEEKGETAEALRYYQAFVDIWAEADDDLTTLIDAKSILAALRQK